ncbi:class I SAM-dependent methyltransferase [Rhizobium rhizogenes]|uniref:class I SAM-dependent methyltransferase n=1 Tax=Rhizobium rhizogenes TaxID=359 RepID=UPI0022C14A2D|nr:class I SAM-dependent methyltransferase [Rhizobium rhizogenes]MCZ7452356.1 class I SAM-dependent methyltransferase [Rhizobium rhizogenes]
MSTSTYVVRRIVNEVAQQKFWLSAILLKRILDFRIPFDFCEAARSGSTLLVGEGNFSFSLALSDLLGNLTSNVTATTFQTADEYSDVTKQNAKTLRRRGAKTIAGVDATNLSRWFNQRRFGLIVFQFPNVGSREPRYGRNPNHILVRRFLASAAAHLSDSGKVVITVVNSPHYDGAFDMDGAADRNDFAIPVVYPFHFADYPGYSHVKTKDDGTCALDENDEFATYVFQRKERPARKWIIL